MTFDIRKRWATTVTCLVAFLSAATLVAGCAELGQRAPGYYQLPDPIRGRYLAAADAMNREAYEDALPLYRDLVARGSPYGQYRLGRAYLEGTGVRVDLERARRLLEKAIEVNSKRQGHAAYFLGKMYMDGLAVEADPERARELFEVALRERWHTAPYYPAALRLGDLYLSGRGGEKDADEAVRLYELAMRKGYDRSDAAFRLMELANDPQTSSLVSEDAAYYRGYAVDQLQVKASEGAVYAMAELWRRYRDGRQVQRNARWAEEWRARAAEAGHRSARTAEGWALVRQAQTQNQAERGRDMIHRSAEAGHGPLLDALGKPPLLSLGLRLGEGSGAAVAIGVVRAAVACLSGMATFAEAGVSGG